MRYVLSGMFFLLAASASLSCNGAGNGFPECKQDCGIVDAGKCDGSTQPIYCREDIEGGFGDAPGPASIGTL